MLTLELAIKSSVLLALACLLVALLKSKRAALRHLILSLAFGGCLLMPMLPNMTPVIAVPVQANWRGYEQVLFRTDVVDETRHEASRSKPARPNVLPIGNIWSIVWAAGAILGMARVLFACVSLEKTRRLANGFRVHGLEVVEGPTGSMPMTYGFWRPTIFLPEETREWSQERVQIVLQHELAHVNRHDSAVHLMAQVCLSLYWWNPLAWWALHKLLRAQEEAADDAVLRAGISAPVYAEHLLEIAKLMQASGSLAGVAMAARSTLPQRIEAILDLGKDRRMLRTKPSLALACAVLCLVVPLSGMRVKQATSPQTETLQGDSGRYTVNLLRIADQALEQGKYADAKFSYDQFISGGPSGAIAEKAYINRGVAEILTKDYDAAVGDCKHAEEADSASRSEAWMWEAIAKENLNYVDEAQQLFRGAVDARNPQENTAVLEAYAAFLKRQGKEEEATRVEERLHEIRQAQTTPSQLNFESALHVGGDVSSPTLVTKVEPEYSARAKAARVSGVVRLQVIIGTDGRVHEAQTIQGLGFGLDEKAIDAVRQWTFSPGTKNGQPVNVVASIEVNFRML